jgi:CRISPR/Cas system-associated exonuclease Cas4 (RecB family)
VAGLTSLFDDYLLSRPGKLREPGVYYVTDLTKGCLRQAYLDIVEPREQPIETQRIFEAGRALERLWVERVLPIRFSVLAIQLPARYTCEGFSIHGRVDALCQHSDGSLVVHECKSAKSLFYTNEPKLEHVQQIQFYLNTLNVEFGSIDYLDKGVLLQGSDRNGGGQVDRCFTVQRDPVIFVTIITRCRELSQFVNAGTLPDAAKPDWYCNYCLHRDGCRVAEGGNEP